jgi:hypothetical protein
MLQVKRKLTYCKVIKLDLGKKKIWNATMQQHPVIVDAAEGRWQARLALQEDYLGAFGGKWILQDLAIVIDTVKPNETVRFRGNKSMEFSHLTQRRVNRYPLGPHFYSTNDIEREFIATW